MKTQVIALSFLLFGAAATTAEGKQAKCWIGMVADHTMKQMTLRLDASTYPFIFDINAHDPNGVETEDYRLYVDWPNNRFTWVDGMMATYVQSEPAKYTYPARCERID